jgi:fructose-bisphosphate aldolase class I
LALTGTKTLSANRPLNSNPFKDKRGIAMNLADLAAIAQKIVSPGKGLLAADESTGTIAKRFKNISVENTEENRRDYRELLFRTENAMRDYISGVILFDETIRQKAKDGTPFVEIIKKAGAIPGIKVDEGAKALAGAGEETVTEGLDGLRERFKEYYELGARFAKWRAVITIGAKIPSYNCINANAQALARYAALAQEAGIVPVVEPEVLMDGDNDIARCEEVTSWVLREVFDQLDIAGVALEGIVLKPNMIAPGKKCPKQNSVGEVAEATVRVLKRHVPSAVPGIAFLSGGQEDVEATAHLSAINAIGNLPWHVTFSYGRALQAAPQEAWHGKAENVQKAQQAFEHRAHMNSLAALGKWTEESE